MRLQGLPLADDNAPLRQFSGMLGRVSMRALSEHAQLREYGGVQAVRAASRPAFDRFQRPLRSGGCSAFDLHSDEAFLAQPCRWVLLHCWIADPAGGGETWLCDARAALAAAPSALVQAATQPLPYPVGPRPTRDAQGAIRFNCEVLDATALTPPLQSTVVELCQCFAAQRLSLRLAARDLLIIDNTRWLHGRAAFAADSPRLLKRMRIE